jgi:hypothetical protein
MSSGVYIRELEENTLKRRALTIYPHYIQKGFMKMLAAKSSIAEPLPRLPGANRFERFSPDCGLKARLTQVYEAAANRHRCVAELLTSPLAPPSESENTKMFVRVELARLEMVDTRKALARHVREHGC